MEIYLKGHNYQYAIEQVIRLFFPGEKIQYIHEDVKKDHEILVKSIFNSESSEIRVNTLIIVDRAMVEGSVVQKYEQGMNLENVREYEKMCKTAVKLAFYRAAIKVRKVYLPWGVLTGIRPTKIVREWIEQHWTDEAIAEVLSEQYAASDEKIQLALEVAHKELKILGQSEPENIGIYVGIPFCPTRCLYCSFISDSVQRAKRFVEPYIDALIKEIRHTSEIIKHMGWKVESVYIGGGTPTTLSPVLLDKLFDALCRQIDMQTVKEFTVEAGRPDTIDLEKLTVLQKYPVNRLSINPQSMNQETLHTIGRFHTPEDIVKAFELARSLGFKNINMDVIAGLPGETAEIYRETLHKVKNLEPENITVHTMSIKRTSRLCKELKEYTISQADVVEEMLGFTQKFMQVHDMYPYYLYRQKNMLGNLENIGYSKPGYEGIYNVQIMEEKQTIIAMGSGAATKMVDRRNNKIDRIFNVKDVEEYINRIDEMLERKNKIYEYFL